MEMKVDKKIAIFLFFIFIIALIAVLVLANLNLHEAIKIALNDESVKKEIGNKEYEVIDVGYTSIEIVGPNETFSGEVPVVEIKTGNETLMVFVDIEQGKVIRIRHQWEKPPLTPPPTSED
ncbi:hypothetical protein C5S30_04005 [ANME-1 cluster archaeon GoMg4]|nr:hypothetical protein [ANME-1 cluster archaeon GoMg4]